MCKKVFSRYGIPKRIISNNVTNFVNAEFKEFSKIRCFEHLTSSPNHFQGNGKAESAVKIAKTMILKSIHSMKLYPVPSKEIARNLRYTIPIKESKLKPKIIQAVPKNIKEHQQKVKNHYDRNTKPIPNPNVGAEIILKINSEDQVWIPKLSNKNLIRDHFSSIVRNKNC